MKRSIVFFCLLACVAAAGCSRREAINRKQLVERHNISVTVPDSLNPLSLGNGSFAFTADITGLQTFPGKYENGIELGTMAEWAWHTDPNPEGYSLDDVKKLYDAGGREVSYVHQYSKGDDQRKFAASEWLRGNPHRVHLGFVGLNLLKADGSPATPADIASPVQKLDLWRGLLESSFVFEGNTVRVITVCHPGSDLISARIESSLVGTGRLGIKISFPAAVAAWSGYDMNSPLKHTSVLKDDSQGRSLIVRTQDSDTYYVEILRQSGTIKQSGTHEFLISPGEADPVFTFSCRFGSNSSEEPLPEFDSVAAESAADWEKFWNSGAAVDFSGSADPRASELERRVVLSQYLTRIQCSGTIPPSETGLTFNSWFGKSHLEMLWWHSLHYVLWGRPEALERQMEFYRRIMPLARETALGQGYKGVRWPKMIDPDGRESPSTVGTYLIWQQPHPIFFAEELYMNSADRASVLEKYSDIVFETASFMASYARFDSLRKKYVLGPVLIPAQESLARETTVNPVFELAYWYWALKAAIKWKERSGAAADDHWIDVAENLSPLPVNDGVYLCSEDTRNSWTDPRYMKDHPIASAVLGFLPETPLADRQVLGRTLDSITVKWNWKSTWGWDFPMLAMSAASIGRNEQAVDFLMMDAPKNRYLLNGHNYQDARLPVYLPGNGGILTAVAVMCTEGRFPDNGKWKVRWEKLGRYAE